MLAVLVSHAHAVQVKGLRQTAVGKQARTLSGPTSKQRAVVDPQEKRSTHKDPEGLFLHNSSYK